MSSSVVKEQIKFRSFRNTCMFTLIQVIVYCFQCKKKNLGFLFLFLFFLGGDKCMICKSKMHETFN